MDKGSLERLKEDFSWVEELPLHIQIDIIENHEVIYSSDKLGMHEYFYNYRESWKDQKFRNTMTEKEILSSILGGISF